MSPPSNIFLILLLLLLPPMQLQAFSSSGDQTQTIEVESLITKACAGTENRTSCLLGVRSELESMRQPADQASVIRAALKASLNEARLALQMMSNIDFPLASEDPRQDMAIDDCKELLDLSISEIALSMSEMQRIRAGLESARSRGNLKAWLSAAVGNQDTCLEGFDGTDRRAEKLIKGSLTQVLSTRRGRRGQ